MSDNINIRIALTGAAQVQSGLKAISGAASMLKSALVPLAGAFGVSRIAEEFNRINSEMAKLANSAEKFGLSTEFLSSFQYALRLTGVEQAKLGEAMKGYVEKAQSQGRAVGEMSAELVKQADIFSRMPDGPAKTALALDRFGEAGISLLPVLDKGGDGLREMAGEAKRLGIVISEDAAKAAKGLKADLERLNGAGEGLKLLLVTGVTPALSDMAKTASAALTTARGTDTAIAAVAKGVSGYASTKFNEMARTLTFAGAGLAESVEQVFSKDKRMSLGGIIKAASAGVDEFDERLRKLREPMKEVVKVAEVLEYGPFRSGATGPNVISGRMTGLEGMTEVQKRDVERERARNRILSIERQIASLQAQNPNIERGQTFTEGGQIQVTEQLVEYRKKMAELQGESEATAESLRSLGGSETAMVWNQTFLDLQNQWGSLSGQLAASFANTFNAAVGSISSGLTSVIMQTRSWGEALAAIGNTIMTTIVQSIVEMGVRWAMTHVFMKGITTAWEAFKTAMRAKDVVQSNATELAKTPTLGMNAILASIGSYGVAAAIGAAAVLAIMAGTGGFKGGGYTGDGDPNQVAGVVHRGEYVVPASAVSRIGIDNLEMMRSGGGADPMPIASSQGGTKVNLATFDSRQDARQWADSQEAETWFVDMSKRTAYRWQKS